MTAIHRRRKALRTAVSGAIALALFAGSAVDGKAPRGVPSVKQVEKAMKKGKIDQAIEMAEGIVAASPRDANSRLLLAQAYLKAGRFDAASTTFNDAMELGDNSARTALALSLSSIAAGRRGEAVAVLDDWRSSIPASDLGLAYSLAGETGRGVAILTDALRGGENTPKVRQNLAYAYALDGRWGEARIMAAQDVPADKLDARISDWAAKARPEDYHARVAALLSVPVRSDSGQPMQLALNQPPASAQFATEAAASDMGSFAAADELPALGAAPASVSTMAAADPDVVAPAAANSGFQSAFAEPKFVSKPLVQQVPSRVAAASPAPAVASAPVRAVPRRADGSAVAEHSVAAGGTHLVQLGSFSSEQGARRAWGIYTQRHPELKNYRMTITPAHVRGRDFWRVAAAGLDNGGAGGLCATVKSRGGACFAYAASSPPPTNVPGTWKAAPQRARR